MSNNVFCSSGGGIRIGASWGAESEGERQAKFHWSMYDTFIGTSAGALDAALTANRWGAKDKKRLYLETDFGRLFAPPLIPFGLRKAIAPAWPISLQKLADFIDGLGLKPHPGLMVNSVSRQGGITKIWCEEIPGWVAPVQDAKGRMTSHDGRFQWIPGTFTREGFGRPLVRSMVLPGLKADDDSMDGGWGYNGLLPLFTPDTRITFMNLGYAGQGPTAQKEGFLHLVDELMFGFEYKAYLHNKDVMADYPGAKVIYPKVWDVDSSAFNLSRKNREAVFFRGADNSAGQW